MLVETTQCHSIENWSLAYREDDSRKGSFALAMRHVYIAIGSSPHNQQHQNALLYGSKVLLLRRRSGSACFMIEYTSDLILHKFELIRMRN